MNFQIKIILINKLILKIINKNNKKNPKVIKFNKKVMDQLKKAINKLKINNQIIIIKIFNKILNKKILKIKIKVRMN